MHPVRTVVRIQTVVYRLDDFRRRSHRIANHQLRHFPGKDHRRTARDVVTHIFRFLNGAMASGGTENVTARTARTLILSV